MLRVKFLSTKKIFFWLALLIPLIILIQYFLLKPNQLYGFYDVDWGWLAAFKKLPSNPLFPQGIIERYLWMGPYAHESYYVGILVSLLGLNFQAIQIASQVFKAMGIIIIFLAIFYIFNLPLLAFITAILVLFSFGSIGSLSNVVTGAEYIGIIFMAAFFWSYALLIKSKTNNWKKIILAFIFLYFGLVTNTTRLFPLTFVLFFIEIFILLAYPKLRKITSLRMIILLGPIIIVYIFFPSHASSWLIANAPVHIANIQKGDYSLILQPFISLGSILLPQNYWRYLAEETFFYPSQNSVLRLFLNDYALISLSIIKNIVLRQLIVYIIITGILSFLIFKRSKLFFFQVITLFLFTAIIGSIFMANLNKNTLNPNYMTPALLGIYVFIFGVVSLIRWKRDNEELATIGLFTGPIIALIMIFFTWIATNNIPFFAPHRYLTIPSIWISFFIASITFICISKIYKKTKNKYLCLIPILLLFPLLVINVNTTSQYFKYELDMGYGARDQLMMRQQLFQHLTNLPSDKPSLFYFDYSDDMENSKYYGLTITNGFQTWMLWNPKINFEYDKAPDLFLDDKEKLQSLVTTENGQKVIYLNKIFYDSSHFFAFKLKDKKVIDITKELEVQLGILKN